MPWCDRRRCSDPGCGGAGGGGQPPTPEALDTRSRTCTLGRPRWPAKAAGLLLGALLPDRRGRSRHQGTRRRQPGQWRWRGRLSRLTLTKVHACTSAPAQFWGKKSEKVMTKWAEGRRDLLSTM